MKKVKKMESLKNFSLSAEATSKLEGGSTSTGGGSMSNRTTWKSDTIYYNSDGSTSTSYEFYKWESDAPIANGGRNEPIELSFDGVADGNAQPAINLSEYTISSFLA